MEVDTKTAFILSSAILRDSKGRILFLKRSNNHKTFKGHWQFLEGKVEFGEHPEEALVRETKEETGLIARSLSLKSVASWSATIDEGYQLIRILYEGRLEGEIHLSDEHETFLWATVGEAMKLEPKIAGLAEILEKLNK